MVTITEAHKEQVAKVIRYEKLKTLLYPTIIFSFIYGVWISMFPEILNTYNVYHLIRAFMEPYQVGGIFIMLSVVIFLSFKLNQRTLLLVACTLLLMLWSMFTVAFLLTTPPNTVWLYAASMTYFSFSLVRRV